MSDFNRLSFPQDTTQTVRLTTEFTKDFEVRGLENVEGLKGGKAKASELLEGFGDKRKIELADGRSITLKRSQDNGYTILTKVVSEGCWRCRSRGVH